MGISTVSFPASSSVKTLLNGLFDYAGLFPPASLSLSDAFSEYVGHRAEADAWMTGPFVIPVAQLPNVAPLLRTSPFQGRIGFDVLPRSADSVTELLARLEEDLTACQNFLGDNADVAEITAFEFRFPEGTFLNPDQGVKAVLKVSDLFDQFGFGSAHLFGELVRTSDFAAEVTPYFLSLSSSPARPRIAGKIRCGGMKPTDFPSPAELASFIHVAVQLDFPFKATAGLHHPIRHLNTSQNVPMHGFMNVMFATTLARVHNLNPTEIQTILEDESPRSFIFDKSGIAWQSLRATNTDFIRDRRSLALSIGSCSFNEPRADLYDLGWLTASI